MRALLVCVIALAALLAAPSAQQRPSGALTPQIESILKHIKAADKGQLAVSEEDGRFLRLMIAARGAKSILEIGARAATAGSGWASAHESRAAASSPSSTTRSVRKRRQPTSSSPA